MALVLLTALTFTSTATALPAAIPRTANSQRPHPAVVRVIVPQRDGSSQGSGTLVEVGENFGLVITNWHVVKGASGPIVVVFPDGFQSAARVLKSDRTWDLAALVVARPEIAPVAIATSAPQPGERLSIAGYGSGWYRAAVGRCTGYVAPATNMPHEMVELSIAARNGDSGGPIFNTRGELAGVLFGAGRTTTTGSYSGRVRHFLASVSRGTSPSIASKPAPRRTLPLRPLQRPAEPLRNLGSALVAAPLPETPRDPYITPPTQPAPWSDSPAVGQDSTLPSAPFHLVDIVGHTPQEQIKSVLAAVGAIAVVWMVVKLVSRENDE